MSTVHLARGRSRPIWAGHPWVLSGAVARVEGDPGPGDVVLVADDRGRPIGKGFYAPGARIRVRMLTREPDRGIDEEFLAGRIARAVRLRRDLGLPAADTDVYRLVHGAGDGLPGLVADRFGDHAVLQLTIRGMEDRREAIARALAREAGLAGVRLRRVRAFETEESLAGAEGDLLETPVPAEIEVRERGMRLTVNPVEGQKTGHYADHRENRVALRAAVRGGRVLDGFTGTGGFAVAAALGGADEVTGADSSAAALALAEANAERNGVAGRARFLKEDVFRLLRRLEREGRTFDAVVLDPPRMASRRKDLPRARKGYKELNLRALRLVAPGGLLATASCTGMVPEEEFLSILRDAALDAKREVTVVHLAGAGPDHPWPAAAPETRYLKFALARVW